jgi:uncharacterized membrane protein YdjX (TVP38/TMEM64 family)
MDSGVNPSRLTPTRAGTLLLLGAAIVVAWLAGVTDLLSLHRAEQLRTTILAYGSVAPAMFVGLYVVGGLIFVPGFVLTLLGGLIFGPWRGLIYASIGSTLGACVAFLIARYAVRDLVQAWVAGRPALRRLDAAVTRHGFRVVMLTRVVPMLPFGVLNYAYGITGVRFATYAATSWACMLPGTAAVTFTAGAVTAGTWDPHRRLAWLAAGGVLLVLVSLVPGWLTRRSATLRELWGSR